MNIEELYRKATGYSPYPYQKRLATANEFPQLLSVPTGIGKTAAAILGWLHRRKFSSNEIRLNTPRRLVYCLPMRTLVEQTRDATKKWLQKLELDDFSERGIGLHLLMGGEDDDWWFEFPERDQILIGTQDMLLSRALNRGYGMSRYQWPIQFALLNNDCHWVFDETQLMGTGLSTTAQLECFGHLWKRSKSSRYLWMSATIGADFLDTVDRNEIGQAVAPPFGLEQDDLEMKSVQIRLDAEKTIEFSKKAVSAANIVKEHQEGRISLLILNTVPTAKLMFAEISKAIAKDKFLNESPPEICLLHGRFRPVDRQREMKKIEDFLAHINPKTGAVANHPGLFIVSTQVIEAGFDISSVRLWSEIAPWSSVVQRLGRLNREGIQPTSKAVFWMPKEDKERENHKDSPNAKRNGPYEKSELKIAKELIEQLITKQSSGKPYREALNFVSESPKAINALLTKPEAIIRPNDFWELFSTDPDLVGGFTDVSHFVRSSDRNSDVQIFWRDLPKAFVNDTRHERPNRNEICSVPVFELRKFVGSKSPAYEWNAEVRRWESRPAKSLQPGMLLMVNRASGGYSDQLGWTASASDKPTLIPHLELEMEALHDDPDSAGPDWVTLAQHLSDVEAEAIELVEALKVDELHGKALVTAAKWHDWGKSLPRWQKALHETVGNTYGNIEKAMKDDSQYQFVELLGSWLPRWSSREKDMILWAKFPNIRNTIFNSNLSKSEKRTLLSLVNAPFQPGLRHEAASALAAWQQWLEGDSELSALAVYLIACHHGKVRTTLRRTKKSSRVFGLTTNEVLRPVANHFATERQLEFSCASIGATGSWNSTRTVFELESPSWIQMMSELLGPMLPGEPVAAEAISDSEPRSLGPFQLVYLEALMYVADIRASQSPGKGISQ